MSSQMEKRRRVTTRALCSLMRYAIAIAILVVSTECTTVKLKNHLVRYYDPKHGTEKEDIHKHFNLHRGRWWNYYDRGSVYLAYGHYKKAHEDFAEAFAKRSRDKWDARTYGMHFIDYFPHRESGVTYYLEGKQETDKAEKEELFGKAIFLLERSLSQEESSRAKFYLNETRRSLLQVTKEQDTVPPKIHVKKPIYTNHRTVRFDVTVTDQDSYVEDIQIGSSCGDVKIDRPRLFVELAQKKVEGTVELTVGPNDKYAVVTITATDLAGNKSDPDNTLIIVDKQAPTAGLDIVSDNIGPDSQVEVSIKAMDYFGLKQIQVGDDPNNKIDCNGAMKYSCNITGTPRAGKLAITIVDNAGNITTTNIPVEDEAVKSQLASMTRSQTSRRSPLTKAGNWNQPLSPAYLPALGFPMPRSLMPHHQRQRDYAEIGSPAAFPESADGDGLASRQPKFDLPPHVLQLGGKETSQDVFYVDGTLRNVESFDKIAVNVSYELEGGEVKDVNYYEIDSTKIISEMQNIAFSQMVDLNDVPVDIPIDITVKAYCQKGVAEPCAEETVIINKRNDCSLESGAVYGILLLPLRSHSTASALTAEDVSMLSYIYDVVLESLTDLHMYGRDSSNRSNRFNVYDVSEVSSAPKIKEWYALKEKDYSLKMREVVRELQSKQTSRETGEPEPNAIDLVIDGNVKLSSTNGEKRFEVTLRAIDVSTTKLIRFPGIGTEDMTGVLADVYGGTKELKWYVDLLAFKVGERFPRLQAEIKLDYNKKILEIYFGKRNRLFPQIKLWLYKGSTERNVCLESICPGKIVSLGWYSCKIRPEGLFTDVAPQDIVIAK
ncbi:MAG: hypothetical protein GY774_38820 [Planctomycetes bacterium]|nr:hypothetical protein [Planctomycetota bacterium]